MALIPLNRLLNRSELAYSLIFNSIHRNQLTGEPNAGKPFVRFGGRGAANQCGFPTAISIFHWLQEHRRVSGPRSIRLSEAEFFVTEETQPRDNITLNAPR